MGTYVVCNLRVPIFVAVESFAIVLCLQLSNLRYNRDLRKLPLKSLPTLLSFDMFATLSKALRNSFTSILGNLTLGLTTDDKLRHI